MKQRGYSLIEIAIIVGAVAALLAIIFGGLSAYRSAQQSMRDASYRAGYTAAESVYRARDNAELQKVAVELGRLRAEAKAKEDQHRAEIEDKERDYAKRIAEKDADHDRFVADINAGRVVFVDPGSTGTVTASAGGQTSGQAAGCPGGGDGHDGGRVISAEASIFLDSEAKRADKIIDKLNLCRSVLITERK